jgi:hypothetical protein
LGLQPRQLGGSIEVQPSSQGRSVRLVEPNLESQGKGNPRGSQGRWV